MLCQPVVSVFKPGPFGVVLRVVSECTATQVAGVVGIRSSLCGTGPVRRPLPSSARKDSAYIVYIPQPPDDTQATVVPVRAAWSGVNGGFQFSLRRENQCGRCEHVITLRSDKSSVGLSHDCSQSCANRCRKLWYSPSPDNQPVPVAAESRRHHHASATVRDVPERSPAWHGIRHPLPGHCTMPV